VQFAAVFGFGAFLSRSRERTTALETKTAELESDIDARARTAVADERARLARDMHDALGHAMSVMTLQVGAVRTGLEPHQTAERETLLAAERAGRDSVAELRRMLGILREGDDGLAPPPSLTRLGDLAATIRSAGIDVRLDVGDVEPLPSGVDAAAFRIVQEALTNVVRHAPQASARVSVQRTAGELRIDVTDDGAGAKAGPLGAPGHGTAGMRERVGMYGGSLASGPRPEGGWTVAARLPLSDREVA
jgi:signal transduction histidine kinase